MAKLSKDLVPGPRAKVGNVFSCVVWQTRLCAAHQHAEGCPGTLKQGDLYIAFTGDGEPWRTGLAYSLPCAVAEGIVELRFQAIAAAHGAEAEQRGRAWTCDCAACEEMRALKCNCMRGLRPDQWHRTGCPWLVSAPPLTWGSQK